MGCHPALRSQASCIRGRPQAAGWRLPAVPQADRARRRAAASGTGQAAERHAPSKSPSLVTGTLGQASFCPAG